MPIEDASTTVNRGTEIISNLDTGFGVKAFLVLFLVFYIVFALVMYRQIQLMDRALPNAISGFMKFIGIIHLGVAIALFFIVVGVF